MSVNNAEKRSVSNSELLRERVFGETGPRGVHYALHFDKREVQRAADTIAAKVGHAQAYELVVNVLQSIFPHASFERASATTRRSARRLLPPDTAR